MEIRKLLVANRGEIAVRIFRACADQGIATVAVVAPDDKDSLHARQAGEVVEIAGYLYSEEHIRAAKQTGADAIHPGYGFIAELLSAGPEATRGAKQLIRDRPDGEQAARLAAKLRTSPEGQEGLRAFLDKRPAAWRSESSS